MEVPVIHSVARGGPVCRAVPGGSIKAGGRRPQGFEVEARHRSELALGCTSRPRERKSVGGLVISYGVRQFVDDVVELTGDAADLAVPEAVVTEDQDLAGDRDLRDLAAAAFSDPLISGP